MLEELRISGLGVIDDAELPFAPGLTVVTGETGAGKTMLVTGLGLLLGGRADAGLVRAGAPRAVVEGRLRVDPRGDVAARAAEVGADLDEDTLLVGRTIAADGRSRAWLGGRAAPASLLGELGEHLVAVHGQADQMRLLRPARQRAAVDAYGGATLADVLAAYQADYRRFTAVDRGLTELRDQARERAREADLLRHGLSEIEAVAPHSGEDAALLTEEQRLSHADALREAAGQARRLLAGDDETAHGASAVLDLLATGRRAVDGAGGLDPELDALGARLADSAYLLADLAADLGAYAASVDADPRRLAAVQERRAAITALTRRYGESVDEVLAWAAAAAERLVELDDDDDRIVRLHHERADLRQRLAATAQQLSGLRRRAADALATEVTAEVRALAMPHAQVSATVTSRTAAPGTSAGEAVFGPDGVDDVELTLAAHAGAAARPLGRGASGGELSRLMLAVEVVLAGTSELPTLVFDEVDAGVGGRAAVEVGRRLARLAQQAQVVVVTHLPQVAAFADRHLRVVKSDDGSVTSSGVQVLDDDGRVRELSRMLAGMEGSASAQAHAEELLTTAAATKSGTA